jgi:amino acid transporter
VILAFVPMLLISIGYSELNKADPDCGTTFTWATRAFGPKTGWAGGWGIIASDVLCMASLAEISGQYLFLLFNAKGIGNDASSSWVLLVGVLFIVALTYVCYRGIEVSARPWGTLRRATWCRAFPGSTRRPSPRRHSSTGSC